MCSLLDIFLLAHSSPGYPGVSKAPTVAIGGFYLPQAGRAASNSITAFKLLNTSNIAAGDTFCNKPAHNGVSQ